MDNHTPPNHTPANHTPVDSTADRLACLQKLIGDLRERAEDCGNSKEQHNLHRSADSLVRLATAMRP